MASMSDALSLQNLHDIVMPPPVSWLPPAPGWYAAGLVLLVVLLFAAAVLYRRWRRNAYRRQALAELRRIEAALADGKDAVDVLPRLPELLKRAALAAYGREETARLSGKPWLAFLDRTVGKPLFAGENGEVLLVCAYGSATLRKNVSQKRIENLRRAVRAWLAGHAAPAGRPSPEPRGPATEGNA